MSHGQFFITWNESIVPVMNFRVPGLQDDFARLRYATPQAHVTKPRAETFVDAGRLIGRVPVRLLTDLVTF
jgi:hypothetical protein